MGFPRSRAEMAISATEGAGVLGHQIGLVTHPNPLHIPSLTEAMPQLNAAS